MTNKSWTDSIKDLGEKAADTADDAYKKLTGHGGTHSKLSTNSNFHSDAQKLARDAERLKDDALRDVDRRFK